MPRGRGGLSADIYAKMFFSTSSQDALKNHFVVDPEEARYARSRSMKELSMGAGYHRSAVPGPQRDECTYFNDYVKRPLDDKPVSTEMRHMFAENSRRSNQGEAAKGISLSDTTTNKAFYSENATLQPQRVPASKPMQHIRIKADAKFMESKTIMQRDFEKPDEVQARKGRGHLLKPSDARYIMRAKFEGASAYKREFSEDKYKKQRGNLHASLRSRSMAALEARRRGQALS